MCDFISGLSIQFRWSMNLFLCQYHVVLTSGSIMLQHYFGYLGSFLVLYKFWGCFSHFCEN
jgi:hypothetical protein